MPNRRDSDASGRGLEGDAPEGVPASLGDLPWELPHTFLGLDQTVDSFVRADALILPVPYESTTSFLSLIHI